MRYRVVFISGTQESVEKIFNVNNQVVYPNLNINGNNYTINNVNFNYNNFEDFAIKALDDGGIRRMDDTELKFVFNFLENHWNSGNKFVIEMESVLYNCSSCQRYMQALQEYGRENGKIIIINFKAHPSAVNMSKMRENL
jgi:hypothetical protein